MSHTEQTERTQEKIMSETTPPRVSCSRRQFLAWSAGLGVGAVVGDSAWARSESELGLGVVGLGERGRRSMERILATPGIRLRGLCDCSPAALRSATDPAWFCTEDLSQLLADPDVDALVVTVPTEAMVGVATAARIVRKPILLARPIPACHLLTSDDLSSFQLVPGLHLSLGSGFRDPLTSSATVVLLELVAGAGPELESAAIEAMELAWSLLGGPRAGSEPTDLRALGGPTRSGAGTAAGHSLRGSLRFEGEDGIARRLDLRFDHRPGSRLHGRLALGMAPGSARGERVGALVPRQDGAPTTAELSALAASLHGPHVVGLDTRALAMTRRWWQRLRISSGC